MNFKKIIATVAAAAVAVTTMAVSTFAIKDYPDGYTLDLIAEGYTVTDVYGFTINISGDIDSGTGGGVGFNSATTGWEQHDWGNADAGKELNGSEGKLTVLKDAPVFRESDVTDPSNPYAQIWMQQWWGTDVTIDSVEVLGADGVVLTPAPAAEEPAADDTAAAEDDGTEAVEEDTDAAEDDTVVADDDAAEADEATDDAVADDAADTADTTEADAPAADTTATAPVATGNTSAAVILSVMAVAGAAAIAAKKRK